MLRGRLNYRLAVYPFPWFSLSRTTVMGLHGDDGEDCLRQSNTEKLGRITQQYEYAGPRTVGLADCCSCRPRNWLCSPQTAQAERYMDSQQIRPRGFHCPEQQSWDSAAEVLGLQNSSIPMSSRGNLTCVCIANRKPHSAAVCMFQMHQPKTRHG